MASSKSRVKVQGDYSREFTVDRGLRQGDSLSCMLFNITLEKIIRNIHVSSSGTITNYFQRGITEQRPSGTLYSQPLQYLAYADDIALLGRNRNDIVKAFKKLESASAKAGLVINEPKTNYMIMSQNTHADDNITINKHKFERVAAF